MKRIIKSNITFIVALVGLFGGGLWSYNSNWDFEPLILTVISLVEVFGYLFLLNLKNEEVEESSTSTNINKNIQHVIVNVNPEKKKPNHNLNNSPNSVDRNAIIESKKSKVQILFIDDDTKFNVVKILKDSGWKNTKTVTDIKSIDIPAIQNADILFIDINGVGKLLGLEYEGLDLSLMIKQKYKQKKVIIYSATKNSNSFHGAWDMIDSRLEKNALPYQFQNLVENYSLEFYN